VKKFERYIAVDLDRTILEFDWEEFQKGGFYYFGEPKPGAVEGLKELRRRGFRVIIYSCRFSPAAYEGCKETLEGALERVKRVFKKYGIIYDSIWLGRGKPLADYYIDDRAIQFTTWEEVLLKVKEE